jgi:hypothetical protein
MMHFLAEGATLVLGTNLLLRCFSPPLAPPALTETSKMRVYGITSIVAAEAIARGMTPLLSSAYFTSRMPPLDSCFELAHAHDPEIFTATAIFFSATFGRLPETFAAASAFLFFRTSVETGTGRGS